MIKIQKPHVDEYNPEIVPYINFIPGKSLKEILEEDNAVRSATISLLKSFDAAEFLRNGTAMGHTISVKAHCRS